MTARKNTKAAIVSMITAFLVLAGSLGGCSSSSSSSKKKWSDLNEREKQNARWAYEADKAIKQGHKEGQW